MRPSHEYVKTTYPDGEMEQYTDTVSGEILIKETYSYQGWYAAEIYYKDNKFHREDGPAAIFCYKDGKLEEHYYLNGIRCDILQEMVIKGLTETL